MRVVSSHFPCGSLSVGPASLMLATILSLLPSSFDVLWEFHNIHHPVANLIG